mmetsp:Transcript_13917/g.21028  ORF Transcript_13917/g.21028 Transcript_13917/m.21028 type:complete len:472 (-) Transcript_13917:95-1510(-)
MKQEHMLFIFFIGLISSFILGFVGRTHLPPPKPKMIGIDLGTTFSCVGAFQAGTGDRLVFHPEENKTTIPSIVGFTPEGVLIGRAARRQAETNPKNTIYDAKRFIGRSFSPKDLEKMQALYPFPLYRRENGSINFIVENAESSGYGVPLCSIKDSKDCEENSFTLIAPEEIGAIIIGRLIKTAEKELSTPMQPIEIKRSVISVPADFDTPQRNATRWAAELAGLEVMRIVSEPTAAALAYGVDKEPGTSLVLVVDLGGGTLDVSLLRKRNGMFWVLGMAGDNRLGGQDFNRALRRYLIDYIQKQSGTTIEDLGVLQRLSEECERAKIDLSTRDSTEISIQLEGQDSITRIEITREQFEQINDKLFKRVLVPIDAALAMGSIKHAEIDAIVLVGGSTRVPRVREIISSHFGGKAVDTRVDPELAVTIGVSIQAGVIAGTWPVPVSAVELPMKNGGVVKAQFGDISEDDEDSA